MHHMAGVQDRNTPTSTNESLCLDILGKLLLAGADINATDNKVPTILHPSRRYIACKHACTRSQKALATDNILVESLS